MKPNGCKVMSTTHHSAAGSAGRKSTGQLRAWTWPGRPLDRTLSGDRMGQEVGLVPGGRADGGPKALGRSGRGACGLSAEGWAERGAEGPASASHRAQESRAGPGGWERGAWCDFGGPLRLQAGWWLDWAGSWGALAAFTGAERVEGGHGGRPPGGARVGSKAGGAAAGCGRSAQGRLPGVRAESLQVCRARGQVTRSVRPAGRGSCHLSRIISSVYTMTQALRALSHWVGTTTL